MNYDDLPLTEIFRLDTNERLQTLTQHLLRLEKEPSPSLFDDAMREAHSLKAAARIINNAEIQNVAHQTESLLAALKKNGTSPAGPAVDLILEIIDAIREMANAFADGKPHAVDAENLVARILEKAKDEARDGSFKPASPGPRPSPSERQGGDSTGRRMSLEKNMIERETVDPTVRIGIERLNKLMNLSGEIYTGALQMKRQQSAAADLLDRIRGFSREEGRWGGVADSFASHLDVMQRFFSRFENLAEELQDDLLQSRLLPISQLFEPQIRFVRDLSRDANKKIRVEISGGGILVDKKILEVVRDPLNHLIRNACDHGLEDSTARRSSGKPEEGRLKLTASLEGDQVLIAVEDDGRGLDLEKIKSRARETGIIPSDRVESLTPEETSDLIYLYGFSTAREVTSLSGRGIGLDVVKNSLRKIGGRIQVASEPGRFTRFKMALPLTLAVTRCLLARVSDGLYAFPLTRIEQVALIDAAHVKTVETRETVTLDGEVIPLVSLSRLWSLDAFPAERFPVIVIGEGRTRVALIVGELIGQRDVVGKPMDERLGFLADISGGTILESGDVALIVDVDNLIRSSADSTGVSVVTRPMEAEKSRRKRVLIVEDTLTVRELEKKVLEHAGYEVLTAVDGLDGFNKAREFRADVIITDIEMPRMDGFELITLLRKEKKLKDTPAIIVSFREREEDKRRGMEVGADKYLYKSQYDNRSLLEAIEKLIGK